MNNKTQALVNITALSIMIIGLIVGFITMIYPVIVASLVACIVFISYNWWVSDQLNNEWLHSSKENIDQELIDFTNKMQEMIQDLQPENIEVLINNRVVQSIDDVQEYINTHINNKGE